MFYFTNHLLSVLFYLSDPTTINTSDATDGISIVNVASSPASETVSENMANSSSEGNAIEELVQSRAT